MTACVPPKKRSVKGSDRDGVARIHDGDVVAGRGLRDTLGSEDRSIRRVLEKAVEVVGRPVVGVLMGQDDRDDVAEIDQGVGEGSRIDDQRLSRLVDGERGVVVLGDSHASSQRPRCAVGKPFDRAPTVDLSGCRTHGIIERLS